MNKLNKNVIIAIASVVLVLTAVMVVVKLLTPKPETTWEKMLRVTHISSPAPTAMQQFEQSVGVPSGSLDLRIGLVIASVVVACVSVWWISKMIRETPNKIDSDVQPETQTETPVNEVPC